MDYTHLGRTGLLVSRLCLGTMNFGPLATEDESHRMMDRALEHGINFFDTANMYSLGVSEEVVGRALKEMARRDEVVVATKVYYPVGDHPNARGLSRKHIFEAIDASLGRLHMDFVDLYQIHRFDPDTPIDETLEALHDVVKAGKARYIGASSMYAWQFAKMLYTQQRNDWTRFVSMQNHYNLVYREEEREMLPLCREEGIGVIPWSPLARGFLAGNRQRGRLDATRREQYDQFSQSLYYADADYDVADRVRDVAAANGVLPIQVALAWLLRQPAVTAPIIGASKLEQLDQLVAALSVTLSDDDAKAVEGPYQPHRVLGH